MTVRLLRWLTGCTLRELAARSGVAAGSLCRYERGQQTPSPKTLERLSEAARVPFAVIEGVLRPALREVLAAWGGAEPAERSSGGAAAWTDELLRALAAVLRPQLGFFVGEVLASTVGPWGQNRPPVAADRQEAPELWAVLRDSSRKDREMLLEDTREYRGWAVCELACQESLKAAPHSAERALEYAELAVEIARLAPGEDLFRRRLQGYAEAHLGNAHRAHGSPRAADEAFIRARPLWKAGAPGDPGLLNEARVLGLESSLLFDLRRFSEALRLLDQAMTVDRNGETKYLLVNRARILEQLGDYDAAIATLRQATPLVDEQQEPRLRFGLSFNLICNLLHLQRFAEGEALLPGVRALAERLGQSLDLVRTLWLEGWVAAGQGRRQEAIAALEQVTREFTRFQIPFDAALAGLELAALYLEEGRAAEVRSLADELVAIFKAQAVHREALAALTLFYKAAAKETATAELARRLGDYLYRAQHDPELQFEGLTTPRKRSQPP